MSKTELQEKQVTNLSEVTRKKLEHECDVLKEARAILDNYRVDSFGNTNRRKIEEYLRKTDKHDYDPLIGLQCDVGTAHRALDKLFIIKKAKLLNLD